ncbi:MAG: AAA family ATPase [Sinimarinibacterium flocculans]|uniref:AAA family ATPase n=1 Tax=Sinimarinibacterium flocculans TaxID=985250 RepID=UPI003C3739D4
MLSGAPSSGKSTVLDLVGRAGVATQEEQARLYFTEELRRLGSNGLTTIDPERFVRDIFQMNQQTHECVDRNEVVVFDRSLVDVVAFALLDGVPVDTMIPQCAHYRFALALIFDPVSAEDDDPVRYHPHDQRLQIEIACEKLYEALGARVVRVPVFTTTAQRAAMVLKEIERMPQLRRGGAAPLRKAKT